jgi:hypothetical protein
VTELNSVKSNIATRDEHRLEHWGILAKYGPTVYQDLLIGKMVAPAELPLMTTPVARLRLFEKWWEVIVTEGTNVSPAPRPMPTPWLGRNQKPIFQIQIE